MPTLPILKVAFDAGGSGLKIMASCGEGEEENRQAFQISPHFIRIPQPELSQSEFALDLTKNLWVAYGGNCYALGRLAERKHGTIPLVDPKKNYMIPRILGAVAVAAYQFGIHKKPFNIDIKLLLPPSEFRKENAKQLLADLKGALAGYICPIGQLKAKIVGFAAKPEGYGLMARKMAVDGIAYQRRDTAVLVFGHRNTSLYLSSGGEQTHYRSNNKGFIIAINEANIDQAKAIEEPHLVDDASVDAYWLANQGWIAENWPESATTAIIGGGPISRIANRVTEFVDGLLRQNPETANDMPITFIDGGMPLNFHQERNCFGKDPDQPWLTAWPDDIGITDEEKRQFADVFLLWAHQGKAKAAV
jgi:hypothetical protein